MVVENPGKNVGDARKDSSCGKKDGKVARACGLHGGENDVADTANQGQANDHQTALSGPVCNVGRYYADQEREKVGWCGKTLGIDGAEAHAGENGGQKNW